MQISGTGVYKYARFLKYSTGVAKYMRVICLRVSSLDRAILYIKTHDSGSRGQEEATNDTRSTAVKLANALNRPSLKLSLSYQRLSTF